MAGGKGSRFDYDKVSDLQSKEKLLLKLGEKHIIEFVIDALLKTKRITRIILAVSPYTPKTRALVEAHYKSIQIFETPGKDYHEDLQFVIKSLNLRTTLLINGDIPLITSLILDEIIEKYNESGKPSLTVMAQNSKFIKNMTTPTVIFHSIDDQESLVPLGINIIDGRYIDEEKIDQTTLVSEKKELFYNINTYEDFLKLSEFCNKHDK